MLTPTKEELRFLRIRHPWLTALRHEAQRVVPEQLQGDFTKVIEELQSQALLRRRLALEMGEHVDLLRLNLAYAGLVIESLSRTGVQLEPIPGFEDLLEEPVRHRCRIPALERLLALAARCNDAALTALCERAGAALRDVDCSLALLRASIVARTAAHQAAEEEVHRGCREYGLPPERLVPVEE